jgi:cell wall-associated NlpC family hydrolase
MSGPALARAAAALAGVPFRLHGRDPRHGLDCIGLFAAAMASCGRPVQVPGGYALRLSNPADWLPDPRSYGFQPADEPCLPAPYLPGDVVMLSPGPAQLHLAIRGPDKCWVHAHAGLRRVVLQPRLPPGELLGHWRLACSS